MPVKVKNIRQFFIALGLLIALIAGGCSRPPVDINPDFNQVYRSAVEPYTFDYTGWELTAISSKFKQKMQGLPPPSKSDTQTVVDFFSDLGDLERANFNLQFNLSPEQTQEASALKTRAAALNQTLREQTPLVENILSQQISLTLAEMDVYQPFSGWPEITFPPVSFEMEPALSILVVSPRDKIERIKNNTLKPDLTAGEITSLEALLEKQDVSALVIPLGGFGATYPSFVIESSNLQFTLRVIAEEWLHQYMAFKPLGFRYVAQLLGIVQDTDIANINETIVGIAAEEIGDAVFKRYYSAYFPAEKQADSVSEPAAFDFNTAMRETRLTVDTLLADGEIEKAESYMETQRLMLAEHGYFIRKLNQAYFAFHGSYANQGTSVDPLGNQVRLLRKKSLSLKAFLAAAAAVTSRPELARLLGQ